MRYIDVDKSFQAVKYSISYFVIIILGDKLKLYLDIIDITNIKRMSVFSFTTLNKWFQ